MVENMISRKIIITICIFVVSVLFIDGIAIIHFANQELEREMKMRKEDKSRSLYENTNNYLNDNTYDNANDNPNFQANHEEMPINLLLLGLDDDKVRSDVILVINYRPWEDRVNMLSISRDTKVTVKGTDAKINAMIGMGGEKLTISKIQQITGLPIDYYITVDFLAFRKIVDKLGGIEIDVPFDMKYDDPIQGLHINLKKGIQTLDGKKAEQFVRYRKGNNPGQGYIDGDIGRINAQQTFIKAMIKQKLNLKYLSKLDDIYDILKQHTQTNVRLNDFTYYLKNITKIKLTDMDTYTYTIPGDSVIIDDLWYYIYDKKKTIDLINEHFFK